MIIRLILAVVFTLVINSVAAEKGNKPFVISYFDHPQIKPYMAIIKASYKEIGIEVVFKKYPIERGLVELKARNIDANLVRNSIVAREDSELIAVRPPLSFVNWVLVCTKDVKCSKDVLFNNEVTIIDLGINREQIAGYLEKPIQANLYTVSSLDTFELLLKPNRMKYGLLPLRQGNLPQALSAYQLLPMYEIEVNHIVHSRHKHLVPLLSKAMAPKLEKHHAKDLL